MKFKFKKSMSVLPFGLAILFSLVGQVAGDCYMQNPRGSNNKLNEVSNNVQNDRRLFDSQNNANSGYQVCDTCTPNCQTAANGQFNRDEKGAGQGIMEFYEGSELDIEWTNQHGCGTNPLLHCNIVIQYACDDHPDMKGLRDGKVTTTAPADDPDNIIYGQHERKAYYDKCAARERNKGLFTADQNLNNLESAIHTRQDTNNNDNRYGWECPEERDYWPYWHPTPFRDVWACTDETFRCAYYRRESQNVVDKGECSNPAYNNQLACENAGSQWTMSGRFNYWPPECEACPTTRNNHNGNAAGTGEQPKYTWRIPENVHADNTQCILRIRYNISTPDFDSWNSFSALNGANSPVKGNPYKDYLGMGENVTGLLRLNINTDQYGRTFEDRSHVFRIRKITPELRGPLGNKRIINLNVRGRRGNIQQTYPAVEYDFVPTHVKASVGDFLHVQWCGADSNDQNNAGNGKTGTDRNNLVVAEDTFPINLQPLFPEARNDQHRDALRRDHIRRNHFTNNVTLIAQMAYLNQTKCNQYTRDANDPMNCALMNAAPGYYNVGLVRLDNVGTFNILSTRNSQFSNREQKGTITVTIDHVEAGASTAIGVTSFGALALLAFFGIAYAKRNPTSRVGRLVNKHQALASTEFDEDATDADTTPAKSSIFDKYAFLGRIRDWYQWEASRIRMFIMLAVATVGVFLYGFFSNQGKHPAPYFPWAKGCGKVLDITMSFILIPVLRNFLSFLRSTPAAGFLPLDDNLLLHKITAAIVAVASVGHITFHYLDFVFMASYHGIPLARGALGNVPGITGHIIVALMIVMFITAIVKRKVRMLFGKRLDGYRIFMSVHKLWIPIFALLWIHSPNFWPFSIWPLAFMAIEKFIQSKRSRYDITIVEARMVGKDILSLKMTLQRKGQRFRYKAGQYMFINCADVSETEWHPFTITSAPEDPYFSCHIRCRSDMDWTYRLRQRCNFADRTDLNGHTIAARKTPITDAESELLPVMKVDGPYGSASEEVFDHDVVVLVGAGIGVTPFISILKSIALKMKLKTADEIARMNVYFYWICRDQVEFDSFKDVFYELLEIKALEGHLELNTYATGEINLKEIKVERYNQFSGRPNWDRVLKQKGEKHSGENIGVFLCGAEAIAVELSAACKKNSHRGKHESTSGGTKKTVFKFRKENF